ncbi:(p)ppGpp synthetase [Undibacterium sp. FT79W]|uniref:GTP pyrophosphokinase n=1 Tax=Undibacterium sp. FT79W TaxID=2762296 RepID=UPI00164B8CD6|nr:(p)ppGpp synthetase [Undibacterium sp. FT79W]MBC3876909.1 (p)ppGpp synthetase [Undibacterium sp. FT79W]
MPSLDFEREKSSFSEYWNENHEIFELAKNAFIVIIDSLIASDFAVSAVIGRVKDREECIKKFSRKYQTDLEKNSTPYEIKDHITDLVGLRVLCMYESDVIKIKNSLSKEFEVIGVTDKITAMESKEDSFGYKGLHIDLKLQAPRIQMKEYQRYSNLRFEVQIRTIIQDAWSVLDHKIKYKQSIPLNMKRRINTLAALFELADREFFSIKNETEAIQAKAKNTVTAPSTTDPLDAFSFLAIAEEKFPGYRFQPHKVDGFVSEIIAYEKITPNKFKEVVQSEFNKVEEYKRHLGQDEVSRHALNPYTEIRHILYKSNKDVYQRILYNDQRARFDEWLGNDDCI